MNGLEPQKQWSEITCCKCGKVDRNSFCEPYKSDMVRLNLCFGCLFWTNLIEEDKRYVNETAIIKQNHYRIFPDDIGDRRWSGHGGARFEIKFKDGRAVVTHNLWHQGTIPDLFKSHFPDNAVFVHEVHGQSYGTTTTKTQ